MFSIGKKTEKASAAPPAHSLDTGETAKAKAWLSANMERAKRSGEFFIAHQLTPALAELLREMNTGNRPKKQVRVNAMVQSMKEGAWQLTHQAIAITDDGVINDGQHRIEAVIQSGVTVPMRFAFGQRRSTFDVIDTGSVRGKADILAIAGEQNWALLAAIAVMVESIEGGRVRGIRGTGMRNDQIVAFVDERPTLRTAAAVAQSFVPHIKVAPTPVGVAYYLCSLRHPKEAAQFFETLRTGLGLSNLRDPIYALRRRLLETYTYGKGSGHLPRQQMSAEIIIAFNAWMAGKKMSRVEWKDGADFPEVS